MEVVNFADTDEFCSQEGLPFQDERTSFQRFIPPEDYVAARAFFTRVAIANGKPIELSENGSRWMFQRHAVACGFFRYARPPSRSKKRKHGFREIKWHLSAPNV